MSETVNQTGSSTIRSSYKTHNIFASIDSTIEPLMNDWFFLWELPVIVAEGMHATPDTKIDDMVNSYTWKSLLLKFNKSMHSSVESLTGDDLAYWKYKAFRRICDRYKEQRRTLIQKIRTLSNRNAQEQYLSMLPKSLDIFFDLDMSALTPDSVKNACSYCTCGNNGSTDA